MRIQGAGTKRGSVDHEGTKKRTMPVQLSIKSQLKLLLLSIQR